MPGDDLLAQVGELLGDAVIDTHARLGDATVLVDAERIAAVLQTLRELRAALQLLDGPHRR